MHSVQEHISTWSILCTYLNMKYIMHISQHEVYYAHISTWSILCTYLNMKYEVVVSSNLILAKRRERPNHLIKLASIKSSIWYEGCKTIEGKGHMTGMKIMSFWVPNTENVSRKHSVRITWRGSMRKIFNNYHSPPPYITRISVWAMINSQSIFVRTIVSVGRYQSHLHLPCVMVIANTLPLHLMDHVALRFPPVGELMNHEWWNRPRSLAHD